MSRERHLISRTTEYGNTRRMVTAALIGASILGGVAIGVDATAISIDATVSKEPIVNDVVFDVVDTSLGAMAGVLVEVGLALAQIELKYFDEARAVALERSDVNTG